MNSLTVIKARISTTGKPHDPRAREVDAYVVDGMQGLAYTLMTEGDNLVVGRWVVFHTESGSWVHGIGFHTPDQAQALIQRIGKLYDWTRTANEIAEDPDLYEGAELLATIHSILDGVYLEH